MNESDARRFEHMLRYARIGVNLIENETRDSLDNDIKLMLALVKAVEIVGEAAGQISAETRVENSGLPWKAMIGMRHILVHEYFSIDLDILWGTASIQLPSLVNELEKILPVDPPPHEPPVA